jgi:hypothetical protein
VVFGEPIQQGCPVAGAGGQFVEDGQQVAHLVEGETERFHPLHHAQSIKVGFGVKPESAVAAGGRHDEASFFVVADGADAQAHPVCGFADLHVPSGRGHSVPAAVQWPAPSLPARFSWKLALASFSPRISTCLPRAAYLVVMASRAATEEASQMWAPLMSTTTRSGSLV